MIQKFMLCWGGNPDALIHYSQLYLTRVFDVVSLKLFYNYGRLPWVHIYGTGGDERGRVLQRWLDYDKDWIQTEKGYHCKLCGNPLRSINPRLRKFCPHCENEFDKRYVQADYWSWFRERVYKRDKGHCVKCGKELGSDFVCDHIIPLSKGGTDWIDDPEMINFQTLCTECNAEKTAMDLFVPKKAKEKAQKYVSIGWLFEKPINHTLEKYLTVNLA